MHFQQVAVIVMAFASWRGGTVIDGLVPEHPVRFLTVVPPTGANKIVVEQDNQDAESWYVRLANPRRALQPALYFPPVDTPEALQDTLRRAWDEHRRRSVPGLSRFLEPPSPPARTPPRSASPAREQRAVSPQSFPRRAQSGPR